VYDKFASIAEAKRAYRRARTMKHFILTDPKFDGPCIVCGQPLNVFPEDTIEGYRGNRCEYLPKRKQCVVMHYVCAWNITFKRVYEKRMLF
jgi:hypothetical protein